MMFSRQSLFRALCYFDAIDYAPTEPELRVFLPHSGDSADFFPHEISRIRGRYVFSKREQLVLDHERKETFLARKFRRAKRVAHWLARLDGVRFVALCNTTAILHADDQADLDFFIICKNGTLWQTRALALLPLKLLRLRPNETDQDPICLSFWIDDNALDLSKLRIKDDVYFDHWFLSLIPLYDDGVGDAFWEANRGIWFFYSACKWEMHPELEQRARVRIPAFLWFEWYARWIQEMIFPEEIRLRANQDSSVVISDHILKFHVRDRRAEIRDRYHVHCIQYGISF